jgi:UV DNA damage endonuclease
LDEFKVLAAIPKCRISNHPDQFNVLASENKTAVESTIRELNFQSWLMDSLNIPANYNYPINIHLNCSSGNHDDIAKRFWENFDKLDDNTKKRLVLEVEDKGAWNAEKLCEYFGSKIPITFDYLHHLCNPGSISEEKAYNRCYDTWNGHLPLFHYSESQPNQNNPRKHADWATSLPNTYQSNADIDFEFKMKDLAILKILKP